MLSVSNAWGAGFKDDFNRSNGPVGNGWAIQTDGTIKVEIVDNEVLIAGTEGGTAWNRAGISRPVSGETRVSFDFKADDVFNVHLRVEAAASPAWLEIYAWAGGPFSYANSTDGSWPAGPWTAITGSNMLAGQYNTVELELKGTDFIVTLNGKVVGTVTNASFTTIESVQFASDADANQKGSLHIDNVQIGVVVAGTAKDPSPAIDATDVPRDVVLGWTPGEYANTHNVYLGTSFEDVNKADVTKAVSKGQTGTTFKPASLLEYGKTYYWRVDEVNAPPDSAIYKGNVWSFTAEPYAYTIASVTATASSSSVNQGMTAVKTVDGSGLNASGQHSSVDVDGWLSAPTAKLPAWIQYQFDRAYMVQQMKVWNSNQKIEAFVGFGAKSVLIEYSLDGTTWTTLNTVEFARADGTDAYAGFTVDMGNVMARYVRLTINSNWGGFIPQAGLSEVRFLYVPVQARQPSPAGDTDGVPVDAGFDWREGRQAASHQVYFSTDKAAVVSGAALVDTTTTSSYQPPSLDFGKLYYWRVDEVNNAPVSAWQGDVWSFTTAEFTDIDNFESYTNESPNRVFQTWIDGWGFSKDEFFPNGDPGNGTNALVGYDPAVGNIMETSITHGGVQSMPVEYNNVNAPYYSEVERTWASPQNWTTNGATELSLWFRGNPAKFDTTADGHSIVSSNSGDVWGSTDYFRFVYKRLSGDGSITAKINSISYAADWSKAGVMIRESLDAGSAHGFMVVTPNLRRAFQNRPTTAGASVSAHSNTNAITLPFWVKLERKGNQFTASYSTNGTTWTKQPDTENTGTDASPNPQTINMGANVYIGLGVTSNNGTAGACVTDFSDIVTSASVTGQWQVADIGGDNPANGPDALYVVVTDSANKSKMIVHPNAKATSVTDWTQWRIALTDLTGVNAAAIKKMVIGTGNRTSPKAGGAGMIFIDDLQYGRPIVPVGLVAYYKLENDTLDSSGNGHDGVLAGNAAFPVAYVDGPTGLGKGMLFEGTGGHQYVDLGTFNPSAVTGRLSVALWAKWDGLSTAWQGLIGKRTDVWAASGMMWQIEANQTTGALRFQREGTNDVVLSNAPAIGQWVHIAVTFDGTTARGYINGAKTVEAAFTFGSNRDAPIQFGADTFGGGNAYNGALDEIRLYDVVLTDAEVRTLAGK
jgi:hypothetical protein